MAGEKPKTGNVWNTVKPFVNGGASGMLATCVIQPVDMIKVFWTSSRSNVLRLVYVGRAPYRSVLTHGFVLDERGHKMSKSVGNVIDPWTVIEGGKNRKEEPGYGADVLRLWVSSVDYTSDVMIGPQILRQMSETYRKLRGTLRYLLSNLHDWKPESAIVYKDLPMIDKHALFQLANVINSVMNFPWSANKIDCCAPQTFRAEKRFLY